MDTHKYLVDYKDKLINSVVFDNKFTHFNFVFSCSMRLINMSYKFVFDSWKISVFHEKETYYNQLTNMRCNVGCKHI